MRIKSNGQQNLLEFLVIAENIYKVNQMPIQANWEGFAFNYDENFSLSKLMRGYEQYVEAKKRESAGWHPENIFEEALKELFNFTEELSSMGRIAFYGENCEGGCDCDCGLLPEEGVFQNQDSEEKPKEEILAVILPHLVKNLLSEDDSEESTRRIKVVRGNSPLALFGAIEGMTEREERLMGAYCEKAFAFMQEGDYSPDEVYQGMLHLVDMFETQTL